MEIFPIFRGEHVKKCVSETTTPYIYLHENHQNKPFMVGNYITPMDEPCASPHHGGHDLPTSAPWAPGWQRSNARIVVGKFTAILVTHVD